MHYNLVKSSTVVVKPSSTLSCENQVINQGSVGSRPNNKPEKILILVVGVSTVGIEIQVTTPCLLCNQQVYRMLNARTESCKTCGIKDGPSLTLGTHAQEGYGTYFVCVCV